MSKFSKFFQPNHIEHHLAPRNGNKHAWGRGRIEVDHAREMIKYVEECAYGCGERRETDVYDIHHLGRRCS